MRKIFNSSVVAAFSAAFILPLGLLAQTPDVKTPNKNKSAKLKSVVVKGSGNLIDSDAVAGFLGGGISNAISAGTTNAVLGGGRDNRASNSYATVAGGLGNTASGLSSSVGGGEYSTASGWDAVVGGGSGNSASGDRATIAGGQDNVANGYYATIPGGYQNIASEESFAAGSCAYATTVGSFVWNGDSSEPTYAFGNYTFTVRCEGGARFYSGNGTPGVYLAPNGTQWVGLSDRAAKTDFEPVDKREILSKVASMPVTSWRYKHDLSRRYMGPVAQDFHAAFGLGDDDKGIGTLDSDGVMYAAIQGLVEELKDRDKTIEELKAKSARFEARNEELARSIEAINERLNSLPPP